MAVQRDATVWVTQGPTLRSGIATVVGTMSARDLVTRFEIPYRDHARKTGYQREPSVTRINQLKRDLTEGRVDLPTAILINIREFDSKQLISGEGRSACLSLESKRLFIVDGQHRVLALRQLVDLNEQRWGDFLLPFVCMLGAGWRDELEEFYVVNSTAKSVRTDLALDLLKERAEDPTTMRSLIERGQAWKVRAEQLAEEMAKTSLWVGRIRFPGQPPGESTISSAGFVSSLRRLLATPYYGAITLDNQVKLLDAYWEGLKLALPDAFKNPTAYALQKTIGATMMHSTLIPVLEYLRSSGGSVLEPESYNNVLVGPLNRLEGENLQGDVIRGSGFWQSGPRGAAGTFSSSAGQRVLLSRIVQLLPVLQVE
jgi:DGQHR domain-containing protein